MCTTHPNFPSREWYYRAGGYKHWRWVPGGSRGGTRWTTKHKQRCGGRSPAGGGTVSGEEDRRCPRQSQTMNGKRRGGSRSSPARSLTGCPQSLRRTGAVKLDCRINLGINNVQADGIINTRLRQPYRPTLNTFGGARRRTGLPWFQPFRRSAPQPYPQDWTHIQTRLTLSGLRRWQRRYMRPGRRRRQWSRTSLNNGERADTATFRM